jgi:hypothetical protein
LEKIERCDPTAAVCVESGKLRVVVGGGVDKGARTQDHVQLNLESCGITRRIKGEMRCLAATRAIAVAI